MVAELNKTLPVKYLQFASLPAFSNNGTGNEMLELQTLRNVFTSFPCFVNFLWKPNRHMFVDHALLETFMLVLENSTLATLLYERMAEFIQWSFEHCPCP